MDETYPYGTTGNDAHDDANLPSILSLNSGIIDQAVVVRLVALLRSDVPLHPLLRTIFADAIEGKHTEVSIELNRAKRGPRPTQLKPLTAMLDYFTMIEQGRFIAEYPGTADKVESGIQEAMSKLGITRKQAYAAWGLWQKAVAEFPNLASN
jgi:hypothetical protein